MTKEISKEEYFENIFQKTMEPFVIQLLESKDFSRTYGNRNDHKEIRKKVKEVTQKAAEILVKKMKSKKLLEKDINQTDFQKLLEESVKEALAIHNGLETNSK